MPENPDRDVNPKKANKPKKKGPIRVLLVLIIWLVVLAAVVFLVLFLAAKIGEFNSIADMLAYVRTQLTAASA